MHLKLLVSLLTCKFTVHVYVVNGVKLIYHRRWSSEWWRHPLRIHEVLLHIKTWQSWRSLHSTRGWSAKWTYTTHTWHHHLRRLSKLLSLVRIYSGTHIIILVSVRCRSWVLSDNFVRDCFWKTTNITHALIGSIVRVHITLGWHFEHTALITALVVHLLLTRAVLGGHTFVAYLKRHDIFRRPTAIGGLRRYRDETTTFLANNFPLLFLLFLLPPLEGSLALSLLLEVSTDHGG